MQSIKTNWLAIRTYMPFLILVSLFIGFSLQGQITVVDGSQLSKLKKSTTYVVFDDTAAVEAQAYMEAIKATWKVSKLEFINRVGLTDKIKNGFFFFSIENTSKTNRSLHYQQSGNMEVQYIQHYEVPYLCLWYPANVNNTKEGVEYEYKEIAHIELYIDSEKMMNNRTTYTFSLDKNELYFNINPGYVKNYVQMLNLLLAKSEKLPLKKGYVNTTELLKLKSDTLLVPKYLLIGLSVKVDNMMKVTFSAVKNKSSDLFDKYDFYYKMISSKKLSDKIIEADQPFYYMMFVTEEFSRYVTIVNGLTGEIIYCDYSNLKPSKDRTRSLMNSDVLKLQKKVLSIK